MSQFQYLHGYIGAALMLCLMLGVLAAIALRESNRNIAIKNKTRFWLVFSFFAAVATIHGGGKTNNTQYASSPARVRSVLTPPPTSSLNTNGFTVLPPLEVASVQRDKFSFGGTFTWRGAEGVPSATTIDILVTWPTLTNWWKWVGRVEVLAPVVSQQWSVATYQLGVDQMPQGLFVKFKERSSSAATMDDWDGDFIPGIYEVANGTNPYVSDFENAPKLTVGSKGQFASLAEAFTVATSYSIIQLPYYETTSVSALAMPPFPVMVIGPTNGYARVTSRGEPYAFALQDGQDYETIFQNIYLELLPSVALQAGFWCGGNMPSVSGYPAASATFRNIYLRACGSNGNGFGWYFRKWHNSPAIIDHCVINPAGSSNFIGISAVDAPMLDIRNSTFVNFPKMDVAGEYGVAVQIENTIFSDQTTTTTVANCVFDNSFTNAYPLGRLGSGHAVNAEQCILPKDFIGVHRPDCVSGIIYASNCVAWTGHAIENGIADDMGIGALVAIGEGSTMDSDNDGLTDWAEIYRFGTDPFRADTDGDNVLDPDELLNGSDPCSATDFSFQLSVILPASYPTNQTVWVSFDDEESDSLLVPPLIQSLVLPTFHVTNGVVPHLIFSNLNYSVMRGFSVTGFSMSVFPPDFDNDKIDDFWELAAGLCPTDSTDATEDPDDDYLINVHEYWAGCNPFETDGSDTALATAARSLDPCMTGSDVDFCYYSNVSSSEIKACTNCWACKINISSESPYNSVFGQERAGTLISPRHVIYADHHPLSTNSTLYFHATNGCVLTTVLKTMERIANTDIRVGLIDPAIDTNIVDVAYLLPENREAYLGSGFGLPALALNKRDNCLLMETMEFSNVKIPSRASRVHFFKNIFGGDSGDPVYLLLGDKRVLLFAMHNAGGGNYDDGFTSVSGPDLSRHLMPIQDAMNRLSDDFECERYSIRLFDFESFDNLINYR